MSLCLCHYVATMSLCCVVHTGDINHQYEVFLNLRDLAVMSLVLTRLNLTRAKRTDLRIAISCICTVGTFTEVATVQFRKLKIKTSQVPRLSC